MKRELHNDEEWIEFSQSAALTSKRVQQTSLMAFAPPNQRSKARYMNADKLIKWGQDILNYLDRGINSDQFDLTRVHENFGWLQQYRDQIGKWGNLIQVVETAVNFVRSVGIYRECAIDLENEFEEYVDDDRANRVHAELISFVEEQSLNAKPDEI